MLLIPSLKKHTKQSGIRTISDSKNYYLPLNGYRGNLKPIVNVGEHVKKYQEVAVSDGFFTTKIHAPISGIVNGIITINDASFLHIENDFQYHKIPVYPKTTEGITAKQFAKTLLDNGIEGAGGSRFPTHLKYLDDSNSIQTVIFNGVECEPYLSSDYILMKEKTIELLKSVALIQQVTKAKQLVFAIEKQNKDLKKLLIEVAKKLHLIITIQFVSNTYPQGGELQLIKSVTGKELKKGSIPAQHGILVNNVGTLWAIYRAFFEGKPNIKRIVTISGNESTNNGNYLVAIGTPITHILKETNNNWDPEKNMVVLGGAMMGKEISSDQYPINKGSGGLLIMKKNKIESNNCIKCGWCVDVCPQHLMPLEFVRSNQTDAISTLQKLHLSDCIECGACAYICPSDVPLMENIFDGKQKLLNLHTI